MNLIFVFVCNFLLFNGCSTANIDRNSSHDEIQQQNRSEIGIRIDALNEDFLYPMFDDADLPEILQFAKDPRFSDFIKKLIFPVKYHNYWFNLMETSDVDHPQGNVLVYPTSLDICGSNFFKNVIKYFGESIRKIDIISSVLVDDDRVAEICQCISEYCSDSLAILSLGDIREDTWGQFRNPMSKLIYLTFHLRVSQAGSIVPMNAIFPKLQQLALTYYDSVDDDDDNDNDNELNVKRFVDNGAPHMANLVHLEVYVVVRNQMDRDTVNKHLSDLFQNNPQIRTLLYYHDLGDLIQEINIHLPDLEELIISTLDPEMQPVHLDHVRHFSVRIDFEYPFDRVSFSRLESLNMIYSSVYTIESARNSWITFFKNHQNLKKFDCSLHANEEFVDFLAELPNLEEIRINSYRMFDFDLVTGLIEDHDKLFKLHYKVNDLDHSNESDLAIFHKKFGNEWNIAHNVEGEWSFLVMEKRNSNFRKELK